MERTLNRKGWMFVLPALVLLAVFLIYPIFYSFYLSLTQSKGIISTFVGFDNYTKIFSDPMFILAVKNTFRILLIQVPIMLIMALILASMLNDKKLKGRGIFRTAIFLPAVTSLIAYTILFKMIFAFDGIANNFLMSLGLIGEPIAWLTSEGPALFVLIIAMIWRWTGYNMVFYISAMQNIPSDLYEAASIDGATKIQQFFRITLPQLRPMILFTTVMSTIGTLQLFDEPMNLAQSGTTAAVIGPNNVFMTLSVYIYNLCFKYVPNFGYAATIAYVVVIMIALLSLVQFYVGRTDDEKDEAKRRRRDKEERRAKKRAARLGGK